MIRFLKLHGVDVGESASLPQIPRTPEGRAMGAVPGWAILVDPNYMDLSAESLRNRARANDMLQNTSTPGSLELGQFPNGETSFAFPAYRWYNFRSTQVGFNPDAWSVFTVAHPASADNITTIFRSEPTTPTTEPDIGVRIGFSASGNNFIIWEYGTSDAIGGVPQRLSFNGGYAEKDGPTLLMATFSTREGLKIYANGELAASAPEDKRALEAFYGPGEFSVFGRTKGSYGMTGLLDIDLGWPEHAGYRRAIERFLMSKYSIS